MRSAAITDPGDARALIDAARTGDEEAFGRIVDRERVALEAHCYRMLGSAHDAEDAVQETFVKAWRALLKYRGESALGTWLHRIATNVCIDAIRRRPKRILPIDYGNAPQARLDEPQQPVREPVWLEPFPDQGLGSDEEPASPAARYEQREAVELAFVAALQHLSAKQRAVLILRDVLAFSANEVAAILETSVPSVTSALQRARQALKRRLPEQSQQATLRSLGDERVRELVVRFANAFEAGDIGAILALLAEDATFSMPPYPGWCHGREAIECSWLMPTSEPSGLRYVPTSASGQLALGAYRLDHEAGRFLPICLDVLTVREGKITDVIAFRSLDDYSRFGLPQSLRSDHDR
jgi:RNA polymerase sigma-70 factor, ECF subfamily